MAVVGVYNSITLRSGNSTTGIAGGAIDAGELVARNPAGNIVVCDNEDDDNGVDNLIGIALNSAQNHQPVTYATSGSVVSSSGLTLGQTYLAAGSSSNAGKMESDIDSLGDGKVLLAGIAASATRLHLCFAFNNTQVTKKTS